MLGRLIFVLVLVMYGCNDAETEITDDQQKRVQNAVQYDGDTSGWRICGPVASENATQLQQERAVANHKMPDTITIVGRVSDVFINDRPILNPVGYHWVRTFHAYVHPLEKRKFNTTLADVVLSEEEALSLDKNDVVKITGKPLKCVPMGSTIAIDIKAREVEKVQ